MWWSQMTRIYIYTKTVISVWNHKNEFNCDSTTVNSLWFWPNAWRHMGTLIHIKIWLSNSLLPGRTKPLPEPVLTYHRLRPMASYCIIIRKSKDTNQQHNNEKCIFTITSQSPRCQWVNGLFLCWFKAIVWTNANFIGEPLRNVFK